MQFYGGSGTSENIVQAYTRMIKSKAEKLTRSDIDSILINRKHNHKNTKDNTDDKPCSIPGGRLAYTSRTMPIPKYITDFDTSKSYPKVNIIKDEQQPIHVPFNFGSIDIDWDKRKINLIDDNGIVCQSTPISEDIVSEIGDIDPDSIPDPNSTESKAVCELIYKFILGKDNDTVLSILDNMTKGKIIGFDKRVIEDISGLTEDITNKILNDYNVPLPGGSKQGLIQTVVTFLTNHLKYIIEMYR